jgi:hypothetical protein
MHRRCVRCVSCGIAAQARPTCVRTHVMMLIIVADNILFISYSKATRVTFGTTRLSALGGATHRADCAWHSLLLAVFAHTMKTCT